MNSVTRTSSHTTATSHSPATRRTASWWLTPDLGSVRTARRLTRDKLTDWGFDDQIEVAELLVSELVANALDHAHGQVHLGFSAENGLLRCEVEDENPQLPTMRTVDLDAERGRGLFLVDTLSGSWGGTPTPRGKAIWFELPAFAEAEVDSFEAFTPMAA
ncbi:ATP-binding protein [Nonomuraea sp. NPDC003709]|uniref:ATP-binding protein n=1 Tax=Nonomuraea sp. NPDC003709 TaxID=3154450 RepID=UPI0033B329FD